MSINEGKWPANCVQRAFVTGASWARFQLTGFTPFPDERLDTEKEAVKRYGDPLASSCSCTGSHARGCVNNLQQDFRVVP